MIRLLALLRAVRVSLLVVHAWFGLAAFDVTRPAGFARVSGWLRRQRTASRRSWAATADVVWCVEEACVWYVKRGMCLQRSAVATWLLRRHGIPAEMVIGFRPLPFESHAWVEVDGQVVNDRPQYQRAFRVLDRL
jgi:hypothetical protein